MKVKKLLIGVTFVLVAALLLDGVIDSNGFIMQLASSSPVYTAIRALTLVVLGALYVSTPPRALMFRWLLAASAICLMGVAISSVISYRMNIIDVIMMVEVAIIFAIEALEIPEVTTQPAHQASRRKIVTA